MNKLKKLERMWIVRYKLNNSIEAVYFYKPKMKHLYTFNSTLKQWKEFYYITEYLVKGPS